MKKSNSNNKPVSFGKRKKGKAKKSYNKHDRKARK
jgi:hypothetical protein